MKMNPDFSQTIVAAHLIESTIMDFGDEIQYVTTFQWVAQIGNLVLLLLWYIVHIVISLWYYASSFSQILESYLISSGYLEKYKTLDSSRVRYLAIVLDSEEARRTSECIVLLRHLTEIGVKNVCMYDPQGLLKKSKEVLVEKLSYAKLFEEANNSSTLLDKKHITLEFASSSDGKEAVAKAADYLFKKNYLDGDQKELTFKESDIGEALKVIGCGQPDPDLLLVYGAARCHLGFPAWRIRYTEIVHMGPLKSMKYGSLIKAIHKFTKVHDPTYFEDNVGAPKTGRMNIFQIELVTPIYYTGAAELLCDSGGKWCRGFMHFVGMSSTIQAGFGTFSMSSTWFGI